MTFDVRALSEAKRAPEALRPVATAGLKAARDAEARGLEALRSPLPQIVSSFVLLQKLRCCCSIDVELQDTTVAQLSRRSHQSSIEVSASSDNR